VCVADLPGPFQVAPPHSRGPRAVYRLIDLHGRKNRVCGGWFGLWQGRGTLHFFIRDLLGNGRAAMQKRDAAVRYCSAQ
jgi:hypothetical protein